MDYLKELEAESIFVIREAAARFEHTALIFAGGADGYVLSHLARKAFAPAGIPFPFLHIDTGRNSPEMINEMDKWVRFLQVDLIVRSVQDSIDKGRVADDGNSSTRKGMRTVTLLDALTELKIDAALGCGQRDSGKARAKDRFFSHRDEFGQWDPKNQRPELWSLFNMNKRAGEHFRVFPLSNWTTADMRRYLRLN